LHRCICPLCGFAGLEEPAWDDGIDSQQICPSCGIQFGYTDAAGGDARARMQLYLDRRAEWESAGRPWWSTWERPDASYAAELDEIIVRFACCGYDLRTEASEDGWVAHLFRVGTDDLTARAYGAGDDPLRAARRAQARYFEEQ
jgi:hypothetical protein